MQEYRIIDLLTDVIDPEPRTVTSISPEKAAEQLFGEELVRSGAKKDLRCRVYFQHPGQPTNMVRLYRKVENSRNR